MFGKLRKYLKEQHIIRTIKRSGLFDKEYYLKNNLDVARSCMNPIKHYVRHGWKEGRNPNQYFDTRWYLETYPDVAASGISPLYHYLKYGWKENRDPSPIFSTNNYLLSNQDVAKAEVNPLVHYLSHGSHEGRVLITENKCDYHDKKADSLFYQEDYDFSKYKSDIKLLAFYLPQFHQIPENDKWWGEGFTEWLNTRKAKSLFHGHYQPREPHLDIGYYDLSDIEVMKKQAMLAKRHGIYGFCFYHYWFNGKRLLEKPVDQLIENSDIDIKFCLCWVNENWTRSWDGKEKDVLVSQQYSPQDDIAFIQNLSSYFKDQRYIRINNKPVILIYRLLELPEPTATFKRWRTWCSENGYGDIYIACSLIGITDEYKNCGFDAFFDFPPNSPFIHPLKDMSNCHDIVKYDYRVAASQASSRLQNNNFPWRLFPTTMLNWDNSPRREKGATVFTDFSLFYLRRWIQSAISFVRSNLPVQERFVFINAWNEWAEGSYLEPDKKYGYTILNTVSEELFNLSNMDKSSNRREFEGQKTLLFVSHDANLGGAQIVILSLLKWVTLNTNYKILILLLQGGALIDRFRSYGEVLNYSDLLERYSSQDERIETIKKHTGNKLTLIYVNSILGCRVLRELSALNAPIITHVHELKESINYYADKNIVEQMLFFTDRYIACSSAVQKYLQSHYNIPLEKIDLVNTFIDHSIKILSQEDKLKIKQELDLPLDKMVVIGCGLGLFWRKGADIFINLARKVIQEGLDVLFIWVGGFSEKDSHQKYGSWKKIYSDLRKDKILKNKVKFLGVTDKTASYLQAADVFVLSSREDPFPLVCLEAAQAELPIICFRDAGGMPDFVENDIGFVVPFEDVNSMADKLCDLLLKPEKRKNFGQKARKKLLERHITEVTAPRIVEICEKVMKNVPRVSVIVPVYNGKEFLRQRLQSILEQDYNDFEVIIIDDLSTDNSFSIAKEYVGIPNVRFIQNTERLGVFKNWFRGVREAKGEIIWIAEQDDYCESTFLSKLLPAFEDENVVLVYSNSHTVNSRGNVAEEFYLRCGYYKGLAYDDSHWKQSFRNRGKNEIKHALGIKNTIPNVSAVLMRKKALLEVDTDCLSKFTCGGDWYIYLELLKNGDLVYCLNSLNYHRRYEGSVVAKNIANFRKTLTDYNLIHKYVIENFDVSENMFNKMIAVVQNLRPLWPNISDKEFKSAYNIELLKEHRKYMSKKFLDFSNTNKF